MHLLRDSAGVILDCLYLVESQVSGRKDTCRVSGVDSCQLDVLHNSRNEYVLAVADSICLTLGRMVEETVNQNRAVRSHAYCLLHVEGHSVVVVYNLHAASA